MGISSRTAIFNPCDPPVVIKAYVIGDCIAATLTYRDVKAKVVKAEYLVASSHQTGWAKDRGRVVRLLEGAAVDRTRLARILKRHGLVDRLKRLIAT